MAIKLYDRGDGLFVGILSDNTSVSKEINDIYDKVLCNIVPHEDNLSTCLLVKSYHTGHCIDRVGSFESLLSNCNSGVYDDTLIGAYREYMRHCDDIPATHAERIAKYVLDWAKSIKEIPPEKIDALENNVNKILKGE